jgi:hypothetical protein
MKCKIKQRARGFICKVTKQQLDQKVSLQIGKQVDEIASRQNVKLRKFKVDEYAS